MVAIVFVTIFVYFLETVNSKFENLPGKKELHLCIKTVATKTVEEPEKYSKLGPAIIQEFRGNYSLITFIRSLLNTILF